MIAIPVKTQQDNPALSPLFGKAKWFAFIDKSGEISIEPNSTQNGREVVAKLVERGVTTLIFHHMGGNPFMMLQSAGITCYHDGGERIVLQDALTKLKNSELMLVDGSNMSEFIETSKGKKRGKKGHGGHHHH